MCLEQIRCDPVKKNVYEPLADWPHRHLLHTLVTPVLAVTCLLILTLYQDHLAPYPQSNIRIRNRAIGLATEAADEPWLEGPPHPGTDEGNEIFMKDGHHQQRAQHEHKSSGLPHHRCQRHPEQHACTEIVSAPGPWPLSCTVRRTGAATAASKHGANHALYDADYVSASAPEQMIQSHGMHALTSPGTA